MESVAQDIIAGILTELGQEPHRHTGLLWRPDK